MVINEYYIKYKGFFNLNCENVYNDEKIREKLQSDKKFDAVFDLNFIEFESFYIIL